MTIKVPPIPWRRAVAALVVMCCAAAAPATHAQSRGELLYTTHCVACHSTQMHWRDNKQVVDWASLRAQVQRWQASDRLGWSDDDVEQVAQHLNALFYRLPPPAGAKIVTLPALARTP